MARDGLILLPKPVRAYSTAAQAGRSSALITPECRAQYHCFRFRHRERDARKMMIRNTLLTAAAAVMLAACVPSGGGERPPTFGSTELQEGFTPDPLAVQVRAGGGARAQNRFAGSC